MSAMVQSVLEIPAAIAGDMRTALFMRAKLSRVTRTDRAVLYPSQQTIASA